MVEKIDVNYFTEKTFPAFHYPSITKKKINVIAQAEKLFKLEKKTNLILGYDYPRFWFVDFRTLIAMIDVYWLTYFSEVFENTTQLEIITALFEIAPIRNAIAHHRFVSDNDFDQLNNCYELIKKSLAKRFLVNYNELAFNKYESSIQVFKELVNNILFKTKRGSVIEKDLFQRFQSSFSILYQLLQDNKKLSLFNESIEIIQHYNSFSRKPGKYSSINKFLHDSNLEQKLKKIKNI